jgi:ketosteroid isomerase-like protein
MSRGNVELVRDLQPVGVDLVQLFGPDDASDSAPFGSADLFEPDFEVRFIADQPGLGAAEYRGLDGFVAGWREWLEPWGSYRIDLDDIIDAGDDVLVLIRVRARTARDGVEMEHAPAAVWTIRDGKVSSLRLYLNRDQAFEVVGAGKRATGGDAP